MISRAMKRKKKKKYECEYCQRRFFTLSVLSQHIKNEHSEQWEDFDTKHRQFACKICPEKFFSERTLGKHLTLFHQQYARCRTCGLVLYSPEKLRYHEKRHSLETDKPGKCDLCEKEFSDPAKLTAHRLLNRYSRKCLEMKNAKIQRKQERIKKKSKPPSRVSPCPVCGIKFKTLGGMKNHKLAIHGKSETEVSSQQQFKCLYCDQLFYSNYKWNRHMFDAHNHNSRICDLCGKKLTAKNEKIHMESHERQNIPCDECDKTFNNSNKLDRHKRNIHQPDSDKPYKCSEQDCTRAFNYARTLESHRNSHFGIKPYSCEICGTKFQNLSNKQAHFRKIHRFT